MSTPPSHHQRTQKPTGRAKVGGAGPARPVTTCTDTTGDHQSFVGDQTDIDLARHGGRHITRIERI